jgi:hypothetical protein
MSLAMLLPLTATVHGLGAPLLWIIGILFIIVGVVIGGLNIL